MDTDANSWIAGECNEGFVDGWFLDRWRSTDSRSVGIGQKLLNSPAEVDVGKIPCSLSIPTGAPWGVASPEVGEMLKPNLAEHH